MLNYRNKMKYGKSQKIRHTANFNHSMQMLQSEEFILVKRKVLKAVAKLCSKKWESRKYLKFLTQSMKNNPKENS